MQVPSQAETPLWLAQKYHVYAGKYAHPKGESFTAQESPFSKIKLQEKQITGARSGPGLEPGDFYTDPLHERHCNTNVQNWC